MDSDERNESAQPAQPNGMCVWDFTYYPDNENDKDELIKQLKEQCKSWAFQSERCPTTGRLHFQGRVSMKLKTRKPSDKFTMPKQISFSITSNENKTNQFYVLKVDTRVEGPWTDKDAEPIYIPRQYRIDESRLYPIQKSILESRLNPDDRHINLLYDPTGNSGKSTIAAIIELKYNGIDMPPMNDAKELIQLTCNILKDTQNRSPGIILFDMPRAMRKDQLYGLYTGIEQIKKGKVYDCRYHYKCWWFDSPVCWVFTNTEPDTSLLSKDRWLFWTVDRTGPLPVLSKFVPEPETV